MRIEPNPLDHVIYSTRRPQRLGASGRGVGLRMPLADSVPGLARAAVASASTGQRVVVTHSRFWTTPCSLQGRTCASAQGKVAARRVVVVFTCTYRSPSTPQSLPMFTPAVPSPAQGSVPSDLVAAPRAWMVRAGQRGMALEDFLDRGVVAIGWGNVGDLARLSGRDQIRGRAAGLYPTASRGKLAGLVGCLYKIRDVIEVGDAVVTYDPSARTYHVGVVRGAYQFNEDGDFNHERKVEWMKQVQRDELSALSKFSLGSTISVFTVKPEIMEEFRAVWAGATRSTPDLSSPALVPVEAEEASDEEAQASDPVEEALELAHEYRKDAISAPLPNDMEDFVACILRGTGSRARVTPRGPDRGRDIEASPDGLGLEEPRIRVEVKHRQAKMGAQEVRAFLGALRPGDKGLYVSTGGFTREAMYEAECSQVPASLVDLDRLAELYAEFYEELKPEDRELVPLRRVYWPEGRGVSTLHGGLPYKVPHARPGGVL